jgi:hypothetical protein
MFQFAHCPPLSLYIQERVSRHHSGGVAPFGISRLIARMQLPLNVSPVSASFIGLMRLGIHLVLFLACGLLPMPGGSPREQRFVSLASAFLLLVLGKIEVINFTLRVQDSVVQVQVPLLRLWREKRVVERCSPNNWNVESHRNGTQRAVLCPSSGHTNRSSCRSTWDRLPKQSCSLERR